MIVINTPAGDIGSRVLANLLEANEAVRVISRNPAKLSDEVHDNVEVVEGSADDPKVVNQAFAGADVVFWIVPPDNQTKNVCEQYLKFNTVAADAIKANKVPHAIWISTLGTDTSINAGHLTAALAADKPLLDTGVAARILCPATFMDNLLRQVNPLKEHGIFSWAISADSIFHNVAIADIVAVATELLVNLSWQGQERVPLVGPDNLTPNQMANIMSDVLGKHISYEEISPEVSVTNMVQRGMSEAAAQGLTDMAVAQSNGFYKEAASTAIRTSTSFREWCENVLKPTMAK